MKVEAAERKATETEEALKKEQVKTIYSNIRTCTCTCRFNSIIYNYMYICIHVPVGIADRYYLKS